MYMYMIGHMSYTTLHVFQVVNPEPCPGLRVHPESGCVPVGGASDLKLHLHPNSTTVFDTELVVHVRGGRKLALKVVGAAEEPTVTIDKVSVRLSTCQCGLGMLSHVPFITHRHWDLGG